MYPIENQENGWCLYKAILDSNAAQLRNLSVSFVQISISSLSLTVFVQLMIIFWNVLFLFPAISNAAFIGVMTAMNTIQDFMFFKRLVLSHDPLVMKNNPISDWAVYSAELALHCQIKVMCDQGDGLTAYYEGNSDYNNVLYIEYQAQIRHYRGLAFTKKMGIKC